MGKRVNTTKKERIALLKELGYTEEQMQKFWDECKEIEGSVIRALANSGFNWTDITVSQMRQLPGLKERTLEKIEIAKAEKQRKQEENERIVSEKQYYEEHFEEIIIDKIENNKQLSFDEYSRLVGDYEVHEDVSPDVYKNMQNRTTIIKLLDRYFAIKWVRDLSDHECHEFEHKPYEVEYVETYKIQKVKQWLTKGKAIKEKENSLENQIKQSPEYVYCNYGDFGFKEGFSWDTMLKVKEELIKNLCK